MKLSEIALANELQAQLKHLTELSNSVRDYKFNSMTCALEQGAQKRLHVSVQVDEVESREFSELLMGVLEGKIHEVEEKLKNLGVKL